MKVLTDQEREVAEGAARVISTTAHAIAKIDDLGIAPQTIGLLATAYIELRDQVRALHDLVDVTDPRDPIALALAKVRLSRRPIGPSRTGPQLVRSSEQVAAMSADDLLALYCSVMHEVAGVFVKYDSYILRQWDGMDGCWTDCTAEVGREEALRAWAARTEGGTRRVAYAEIDYYRIFPGGTRMHWDGSHGREMHR